jgi:hypothetical protein
MSSNGSIAVNDGLETIGKDMIMFNWRQDMIAAIDKSD